MSQDKLLRNYIQDQVNTSFVDDILNTNNIQMHGNLNTYCNNTNNQSLVVHENNDTQLEDFKNKVKIWIKLDNEIKELSNKIKVLDNERKQRKKYMMTLTPHILSYMSSNEIEELNSRDGRLRYKASMVKPPLTQKDIKSKLYTAFQNNHEDLDRIFNEREKIQKVTLRRLTN